MADTMGAAFETNLHYGHSVARVKVQQGLLLLKNSLTDDNVDATYDELVKRDIIAHMLIPFYQGVIKSAHHMDKGSDDDKATAQTEGDAYWKVIAGAVGDKFNSHADRDYLTAMFSSAPTGDFNYCAASARLLNNLPPASKLQYVNHVRAGTLDTTEATDIVHMTEKDLGNLQETSVPKKCTMPPPPSPSKPPSSPKPPSTPPTPPPPPHVPAPMSSSDSLSDGEVAGIAVGAAIGGIALLLILGLALRSVFSRDAKPVFTCIERGESKTEKKPAPADKSTTTKSEPTVQSSQA